MKNLLSRLKNSFLTALLIIVRDTISKVGIDLLIYRHFYANSCCNEQGKLTYIIYCICILYSRLKLPAENI